jgi:hypothetical protein
MMFDADPSPQPAEHAARDGPNEAAATGASPSPAGVRPVGSPIAPELRTRIAHAIEMIGRNAPDDYVLKPSSHAALYAQTAPELAGRLDLVREATAAGELAVMRDFAAAVQDQLSLEHRQWLKDIGEASEAVTRLEERLKEYRAKVGQKG